MRMKLHSTVFSIFLAWPLTAFALAGFLILPALAKKTKQLEEFIVNPKTVHFVAVNGDDNGPGTIDQPWATINHAADQALAGDTVIVRGGHFVLPTQVRPHNSGRSDAWITFVGYPGEKPILDAQQIPRASLLEGVLDNGAFQIEGVSHVRVANLTVISSHEAGFTIRDSSNIDLINNTTKGTFSSGIAVWDTDHNGRKTQNIRVLGNIIIKATTWDLASPEVPRRGEPPHEALSIGGAVNFEVAYNHVYDSDKEGIDIKETSTRGMVHHNLVHNIDRQGIYVDAWFGAIDDIEIFSNVVHDCKGAGLVLSVENGLSVANVDIHNNLIFNNDGSGIFFSRWGVDHLRRDVRISNNVIYHNGYGTPKPSQTYYWLTGGLYLYSTNVRNISIRHNVFSDNRGFQIGYSELFLRENPSWRDITSEKDILIADNLIDGRNTVDSPIESGGEPPDRVNIYAVDGTGAIFANPFFKDPANQDFTIRREAFGPAGHAVVGAYSPGASSQLWWKQNFPPKMIDISGDGRARKVGP
jgi:parallel beta-helix repeat protein